MSDQRIQNINRDLDETQQIMQNNIDNMTRNVANAEELEQQTAVMNENAAAFKKSSTNMKNAMWWKNFKLWLIIGAVVAIIILVIIIIIVIIAVKVSKNKDD
ncbi:hypothetical protein ENUP19_0143G0018 [Entamoeba nuttalli]